MPQNAIIKVKLFFPSRLSLLRRHCLDWSLTNFGRHLKTYNVF